eukprot:COSAG06_NODE_4227_length_4449_cov_153.645057_1_plen_158_part_00
MSHLYIKCIILPRQARDKHRKKLKKWPFSAGGYSHPCGDALFERQAQVCLINIIKTPFSSHVSTENDLFTKTGLGQTKGKLKKKGRCTLFAGLRRCARGVLEQHGLHWLRNLGIRASCAALAALWLHTDRYYCELHKNLPNSDLKITLRRGNLHNCS